MLIEISGFAAAAAVNSVALPKKSYGRELINRSFLFFHISNVGTLKSYEKNITIHFNQFTDAVNLFKFSPHIFPKTGENVQNLRWSFELLKPLIENKNDKML